MSEFNPQTNYQWQADDEFKLNGKEVEILNTLVKLFQADPDYKKFLLINKSSEIMQEIFKRNSDKLTEFIPKVQGPVRTNPDH